MWWASYSGDGNIDRDYLYAAADGLLIGVMIGLVIRILLEI